MALTMRHHENLPIQAPLRGRRQPHYLCLAANLVCNRPHRF